METTILEAVEIFRFGPFELDAEREELRRGGLTLRLFPQPMRLLLMLVRRAGAMVTRDEIEREIWGSDTYVDFEQGINSAIRQIRTQLGDNADAPRYIRTVPRRGYVFVAAVERVSIENEMATTTGSSVPRPLGPSVTTEPPPRNRATAQPRNRRRIIAAGALLAAIAIVAAIVWYQKQPADAREPREIAVVPFRVIGEVPQGVQPRAFAQELRATIGMLSQRSIVLLDENSASRANVRIEGTVQQEHDGVRVIVSGIDAATGTQIWSETYDRPKGKAEGMPIEIAHLVAREVARRFLPPPRHEPVLRTRVSPKAADVYRRGRIERMRSFPDQTSDHGEKLFQEALREEPRFSEAWSALADLWTERAMTGPAAGRAEAVRRAREYAGRALALQPGNVEAQSTMGILAFQQDYDLATAEEIFRRVVAADPEYFDGMFNLAQTLTARGEFDAAFAEYSNARELDPMMLDLHPVEGTLFLRARRYEDALARFREILAVRPQSGAAKWGSLTVYIAQRRWDEAIRMIRDIGGEYQSLPPKSPATFEDFRAEYRRIEPLVLRSYQHERFDDYFVAVYYAQLGEKDRAFEALNRALAVRAPAICYLLVDPRIDPLRADARFEAFVKQTRLAPRR